MKKSFITTMIFRGGAAIAVVALGLFGYTQSTKVSDQKSEVTLDKLIHVANANAEGTFKCSGLTSGCTVTLTVNGTPTSTTVNGYKE